MSEALARDFLLFISPGVGQGTGKPKNWVRAYCQKHSGDPNPQYFSKSTAVQMGGVLPYKWEAYCRVSLSSKLRSQESTAIQMGDVLPYKLEVHCRTF